MREIDNDSDGGIPLHNDQKSCERLKESIVNLEELVNPNRSDYEHVGKKLIRINGIPILSRLRYECTYSGSNANAEMWYRIDEEY